MLQNEEHFSVLHKELYYILLDNPSIGEGTFFLQEYMIPRGATSFCLFDTRSLSENFADNDKMLRCWMTKGVRHGELVIR